MQLIFPCQLAVFFVILVCAAVNTEDAKCCWCGKKYLPRVENDEYHFAETQSQAEAIKTGNDQNFLEVLSNIYSQRCPNILPSSSNSETFPVGFFVSSAWLAENISENMKATIGNFVNPVSPFGGFSIISSFLDAAVEEKVGFQYCLRHSWKNETQLILEINEFKDHEGVTQWYLADEPDGEGTIDNWEKPIGSDPTVLKQRYDQVKSLDPSRDIVITLNCQYSAPIYEHATDIIMVDPYPIGLKQLTQCTKSFGCCGCDNCKGNFDDISNRISFVRNHMTTNKPIYLVLQAFGGAEHWYRAPTPPEFRVMAYLGIVNGVKGLSAWIRDQTYSELLAEASHIYSEISCISDFLLKGKSFIPYLCCSKSEELEIRGWMLGSRLLFVFVNKDAKRFTNWNCRFDRDKNLIGYSNQLLESIFVANQFPPLSFQTLFAVDDAKFDIEGNYLEAHLPPLGTLVAEIEFAN